MPESIDALATKLNEVFAPHGLKVKITFRAQYLQVVVFSPTKAPNQDSVVAAVEQAIAQANLEDVNKITVYGKTNNSATWAWRKDIPVKSLPKIEQAEIQSQSSSQGHGQDAIVAELALIRKELTQYCSVKGEEE